MRKLILCLAFAAALPVAAQYTDVKGEKVVGNKPLAEFVRQRSELFNFGWQFRLSGDSVWRTIDLPHDFQFEQPWDQRGGSARGYKPGCEGGTERPLLQTAVGGASSSRSTLADCCVLAMSTSMVRRLLLPTTAMWALRLT